MAKILVKGGIWKNTEDEILKVAVMKYGKNQWSRIASLLHKKTAKQCKARWYEWLDPSIKKTDWSRDEDEKLLHLAKLMPTQWRTIAPIVGRTAAQCLERYEFLLDKAQDMTSENLEGTFQVDPRKLKPGEIDPNPETKPAKPDAIDMDEDELEMLSEARARLANTQGKKAKRKARERQLDEARRLTSLQKKRELLAAGINGYKCLGSRKMRTYIDYNREIPFEKKPLKGLFDSSKESFDKEDPDFLALRESLKLRKIAFEEAIARRKDRDVQKRQLEANPREALKKIQGKNLEENLGARFRITLPEPQVDDYELHQVAKIGLENQKYYGDSSVRKEGGFFDTKDLLPDYSATPAPGTSSRLRTPANMSREVDILNEARNIISLSSVETPLKGGENTKLDVEQMDFASVNPQKKAIQTPNTLLPRFTSTRMDSAASTVDRQSGIESESNTPALGRKTSRALIGKKKLEAMQIKNMLSQLPEPKDNFEIVFPEETGDEVRPTEDPLLFGGSSKPSENYVTDAADIDKLADQKKKEVEVELLATLPTVLSEELPHPIVTPFPKINEKSASEPEKLVQEEMEIMIANVLANHTELLKRNDKSTKKRLRENLFYLKDYATKYKQISFKELCDSRRCMELECEEMEPSFDFEMLQNLTKQLNRLSADDLKRRAYLSSKHVSKTRLAGLKKSVELLEKDVAKNTRKLKTYVAGYQRNLANNIKKYNELLNTISENSVKLELYKSLMVDEDRECEARLEYWKQKVDKVEGYQNELQKAFAEKFNRSM